MSRKLGNTLPREIYDLVGLDNVSSRKNIIVQLFTVDDSGFPHTCLLSPYQVISFDPRSKELMLLVYATSSTSSNLNKRKKATLVFFIPPKAFYVKGEVTRKSRNMIAGSESVYSISINEVSEDYSPDAPITSNLTFEESKVKSQYMQKFRKMIESAPKCEDF